MPNHLTKIISIPFELFIDIVSSDIESDTEVNQPKVDQPDIKSDIPSEVNQPKVAQPDIESDTPSEVTQPKVQQTKTITPIDIINTATKLFPEFDGKIDNVSKFVNALDIVDTIKGEHKSIAISLIKTKLTQNVSRLITTERSIAAIKALILANVKHEPPQSITAKLLNIKQQKKTDKDFSKEIENLTTQLENACIAYGLAPSLAKQYSFQSAVKAIKTNAKSDEVKMLMKR